MRTVHKFVVQLLKLDSTVLELYMPRNSHIISVENQAENLCFWAVVDTDQPLENHRVFIQTTGSPIENEHMFQRFIGTVLLIQGQFVLHVWDGQET